MSSSETKTARQRLEEYLRDNRAREIALFENASDRPTTVRMFQLRGGKPILINDMGEHGFQVYTPATEDPKVTATLEALDEYVAAGRSEDLDRPDWNDPDQLEDLLEQYQCDLGSKDLGVYEVYYLTQYRRSDTDRPDERFSTMYYDRDSLLEDLVDGKIRWSDWNPFRE